MFFLFLLPEIVNNDVKNNVDAGADNEEEKPQIYYLRIKSTFNCLTFFRPNFQPTLVYEAFGRSAVKTDMREASTSRAVRDPINLVTKYL